MNRGGGSQCRQPFLIPVLRPQLDRIEDAENGRLGAFAWIEAEIADAARNHQPDVVVLDAALLDAFLDHPGHRVPCEGNLEPDGLCGVIQSVEVGIQAEDAAAVGTDALEYAVTIQQAVVEYRNDRLAAVEPRPIDPHEGGHRRNLPRIPRGDNRGWTDAMRRLGIEPRTYGLKVRCSTN